jgi:hypothetical protein
VREASVSLDDQVSVSPIHVVGDRLKVGGGNDERLDLAVDGKVRDGRGAPVQFIAAERIRPVAAVDKSGQRKPHNQQRPSP